MYKLVCYIVLLYGLFPLLAEGAEQAEKPALANKPKIIVTIKPLALIAKSAVGERAEVEFLQPAGQPAHDLRLTFSQRNKLSRADLVIWVGEGMEARIGKAIQSLDKSKVIEAMALPMNWPQTGEHQIHEEDGHKHLEFDPHFWLNPNNAELLAQEVRQRLGLMPLAGEASLLVSKEELSRITAELQLFKSRHYIVHHDAYRHFAMAFNLSQGKAVRSASGLAHGVKGAYQLRTESEHAACIFVEPQYSEKEVLTLAQALNIQTVTLDPQGIDIPLDKNAYPAFMRQFVAQYKRCFSAAQ